MDAQGIVSRGGGKYAVSGEMVFGTIPALWREGNGVFNSEARVYLDLSGVTRVDSAGIAWLIELTRNLRRRGGELVIEHAPSQLLSIAGVCGLEAILSLAPGSTACQRLI